MVHLALHLRVCGSQRFPVAFLETFRAQGVIIDTLAVVQESGGDSPGAAHRAITFANQMGFLARFHIAERVSVRLVGDHFKLLAVIGRVRSF